MGKIFKDIIDIEITLDDSFQCMLNKFYDVMRKYSICQGTWTETGGRAIANPEWTICFKAFLMHKQSVIDFRMLLAELPPELLAYDKKPKSKSK
jgi:hypothetical protein